MTVHKRRIFFQSAKKAKKKFFVLREESETGPSRLEYYDSEKKFLSGTVPKQPIVLRSCFDINRKSDSRHKYAVALFTRDDCFSVVSRFNSIYQQKYLTKDYSICDSVRTGDRYNNIPVLQIQLKILKQVCETEEEQTEWLDAMLELQSYGSIDGQRPRSQFGWIINFSKVPLNSRNAK